MLRSINWRRSAIIVLLFAVTSLSMLPVQVRGDEGTVMDAAVATSTIPQLTGCGGESVPSSNLDFESEVVMLINNIREENDLPPLKRSTQLDDAARYHATDMGLDSYFSHTSHDRVDDELMEVCRWSERVRVYYTDWYAIAENIAAGYATPQAVVDAWMNSPGHRKNILADTNWEIGVGYFEGAGAYGRYWVQDFGRRRDIYPLIIDGEAPATDTGDVSLYLYGSWENVRLRTDSGEWSDWMPFQTELNWRIEGAVGERSVTVEMSKQNETMSSSDTIYLKTDTSSPAPGFQMYLPTLMAADQQP